MNANQTEFTQGTKCVGKMTATWDANLGSFPRRLVDKAWRTGKTLVQYCVALVVRTPMGRWRRVSRNPNPVWDERNRIIASFIPAASAVLDIGCGGQSLKRHLKPDCKYQPSDLVKSSPDVILCDFNAGVFPKFTQHFDFVVCSGVFEYMRNPKQFLELVSTYGEVILLSYHPYIRGHWKGKRIAANWVNHLPEDEVVKLFETVGLKWQILHGVGGFERIYRLQQS
jgi:hypothetical protein